MGNYAPIAAELSRAILARFGVSVRLIPARDGSFEVCVEGRLVFSKKATYRLPDADEIFYHVGVAQKALEESLSCSV